VTKIIIVFLFFTATTASAAEVDCNKLIKPEAISRICSHELTVKSNSLNRRKTRCELVLTSKTIQGVFAPKVIVTQQNQFRKGKNMAPISYASSLDGFKKNGRFKQEVKGIGNAAFFAAWDVHQTIFWHKKDYSMSLEVQLGKPTDQSICNLEQMTKAAKQIDQNL